MDYTFAGFTFHFNFDGSGNVVTITTPDIAIGPIMVINSAILTLNPAQTVAGAEQAVQDFLALLGIS